jgi:hypothetical protein
MGTAIGSYATLAGVKSRLVSDSSVAFSAGDDILIGSLCDQINQFIESPQGCGRVLAPRPVGSGVASANEIQTVTLAKSAGVVTGGHWTLTFNGSTTTDLAWNINGAALQAALRLLPTINGANVTVTGDGPYAIEFIGTLAGLAQSLMTADAAHLTVAPCTATVVLTSTPQTALYYFDGNGSRVLWLDVRSVSELAVATQTGGTYTVVPATDYFLRPLPQDRSPGWPATRIELSDYPTGSAWFFWPGYATVRVKAVVGWPAIPDDITGVALTAVVRAWHARQSGQTDIVGNDETGAPIVSRYISGQDWFTLKAYRVAPPVG